MNIVDEKVERIGPGRVRLTIEVDGVDDKAAQAIHSVSAELKTACADGRFTVQEGASVALAMFAAFNPALAGQATMFSTSMQYAMSDGRLSMQEAIMLSLQSTGFFIK